MQEIKKLALQCILFAMKEVKDKLTTATEKENVHACGVTMFNLADAFTKIKRS